jgi:uncharacterized SAM-binding protein YcdF (DUF218 family)
MILIYLTATFLLLLTLFMIFAPGFLISEDPPKKADAVVLFVGPGNEARLDEAKVLIREGHARYLLIPFTGEMFEADKAGGLVRLAGNQPRGDLIRRVRMAASYKKHYENTHIEALEAKRMMDERGLRLAMLVSSSYHMRRIRLIGSRVFDAKKYSISCNPARWQREFTVADWLDGEKRRIIVSEYVKIGWFLVYGVLS